MKKQTISLILACVAVMSMLTGCANDKKPVQSPQGSVSAAASSKVEPLPQEPSEAVSSDNTVLVPFSLGLDDQGNYLVAGEDIYPVDLYIAYDKRAACYVTAHLDDGYSSTEMGGPVLETLLQEQTPEDPVPYTYSFSLYYDLEQNAYANFTMFQDIYNHSGATVYVGQATLDGVISNYKELGDVVTGGGTAQGYPYEYAYVEDQNSEGTYYFYCIFKITDEVFLSYDKTPASDGPRDMEAEIQDIAKMIQTAG